MLISASKHGSSVDFKETTGVFSTVPLAFLGDMSPDGSFCTFIESVPSGVAAVCGADNSTSSSDFPSFGNILGVSPMRTLCLQLVAGWCSSTGAGGDWWLLELRRRVAAAFLRRVLDLAEASICNGKHVNKLKGVSIAVSIS